MIGPDVIDAVRQEMARLDKTDPLTLPTDTAGGYQRAAAVLDYFDPNTLKPAGTGAGDLNITQINSDPVVVSNHRYWRLRDAVRVETLEQMGSIAKVQNALAANWPRPQTALQRIFEAYVGRTAPPLEKLSRQELSATYQVINWLQSITSDLPRIAEVRQWHDRLNLYQPFEHLANETFVGREEELGIMQAYVSTKRNTFSPLNLYGPGGMGKSTIIAKFILQNQKDVAWVYIDFDQPTIHARRPLTLLIEGVGQIGVQFPDARERCEKLQEVWREELVQSKSDPPGTWGTSQRELESYARSFLELVRSLVQPTLPLLFVLDTFEQVQKRSPAAVDVLMILMEQLHNAGMKHTLEVPVHVIISGRAELTSTRVKADPIIELGDFKEKAVFDFLSMQEVPPEAAQFIAENVGGSPLSLILACKWWERMDRPDDLEALFGGLAELAYEERQGVLFLRILGQIEGEVEKLAFPGLALRRITAEIIKEVLAEPCGIEVPDMATAKELFEKLKSEVTLVIDQGDVLRHRPDVRQVMLRLMREREAYKQKQIEQNAVEYYAQKDDPVSRAEEIYHRLSLGQDFALINARWGDGNNIKVGSLIDARDELLPPQRAWLAGKAGLTLTEEEQAAAGQAIWEQETNIRARELLALGEPESALERLEQRDDRLPGSTLYRLRVEILVAMGNHQAALEAAQTGMEISKKENQFATAIDLAILSAGLARRTNAMDLATELLEQAQTWVDLRDSGPLYNIRIGLERWHLADERNKELAQQLAGWFAQLDNEVIIKEAELMGALAGLVGVEHDEVLWQVLALTGLEGEQRSQLRALGREVAAWDREYSRERGKPAGVLLQQFHIPEQKGSLETSWVAYWLDTGPTERVMMLDKLREIEPRLTTPIRQCLAGLLAARQKEIDAESIPENGEQPEGEKTPPAGADPRQAFIQSTPPLTGQQTERLYQLIREAFTLDELRQMLRFRFDIDLESIVNTSQGYNAAILDMIMWAERNGLMGQLLLALREARPNHAGIYDLVNELSGTDVDDHSLERLLQNISFIDPNQFRERLARAEFQIGQLFVKGEYRGTAFLVGPESILTTYHLVEEVIRGKLSPKAVSLRFDLTGEDFNLADDWLIAASPFSQSDQSPADMGQSGDDELEYALLRVANEPGHNPIGSGGGGLESLAETRGWLDNFADNLPDEGAPIFVLYYPAGESMKVSIGTVSGANADKTRLRYQATLEAQASGAPCFDADFRLVAMQQDPFREPGELQAVLMSAILEHLERQDIKL